MNTWQYIVALWFVGVLGSWIWYKWSRPQEETPVISFLAQFEDADNYDPDSENRTD